MRPWQRILVALIVFPLTSCWTVDRADLVEIGAKHGLALSESDCVEDEVTALGSIHVAKAGFYLFGVAPVVRVSLEEAIEEVARIAADMRADGVCRIRYNYSPANILKFLVFPIPDWSAEIQVFGMAYRRGRPTGQRSP